MDYVVVVAGGKGLRMGGDLPKQFQNIGSRPVLMRTLENLHSAVPDASLILVLPQAQAGLWRQLCDDYGFSVPYQLAYGGPTRFDSVRNGLALVEDRDGVTAVHDGVRPFVSPAVVRNVMAQAADCGAVVPVVPVVETVRQLDGDGSYTVPRDRYRLVQTPQAFQTSLLLDAYSADFRDSFTDDASVVESYGHRIFLAEGNRENIKLTAPFDLLLAEAILSQSL